MIDVWLAVLRWRGQGARMLGMKGRGYKLWWSENDMELGVWE